ncbi:hypothetical protein MHBO_002415 [Bonamia ostreae]|uniref:Secreted protein n=1 Tax=Bonamia ostreae TaxID=126728 RepID=A0ABV2AMA0_9EUKA
MSTVVAKVAPILVALSCDRFASKVVQTMVCSVLGRKNVILFMFVKERGFGASSESRGEPVVFGSESRRDFCVVCDNGRVFCGFDDVFGGNGRGLFLPVVEVEGRSPLFEPLSKDHGGSGFERP